MHQLRYWLAYGDRAGVALARQGHVYLHSLAPWLVLLVALGAGVFLRALGRAFTGDCSVRRYTTSFVALWLACAACLVAIYATQELLEVLLATGHPGGARRGSSDTAAGGRFPASVFVGLVVAALLHGARWVLDAAAERHARGASARRRGAVRARAPRYVVLPRPAPVAAGWSGRGPPR